MSKFGDIEKNRKNVDSSALQKVVDGGKVSIKNTNNQKKKAPFQVMLAAETKNNIKALAAMKGISMTELFEDMYSYYKNNHETIKS
ncbi:hypothetical protein CI610_03323 [invertebrate metagenome]|uniref:Uncharacterized protein n=1 Tax=invertebrate metagenome TaxID=1711999 RepID=A0A2H9T3F4_9ZZZZ